MIIDTDGNESRSECFVHEPFIIMLGDRKMSGMMDDSLGFGTDEGYDFDRRKFFGSLGSSSSLTMPQ